VAIRLWYISVPAEAASSLLMARRRSAIARSEVSTLLGLTLPQDQHALARRNLNLIMQRAQPRPLVSMQHCHMMDFSTSINPLSNAHGHAAIASDSGAGQASSATARSASWMSASERTRQHSPATTSSARTLAAPSTTTS
jgi:hypothetical protein